MGSSTEIGSPTAAGKNPATAASVPFAVPSSEPCRHDPRPIKIIRPPSFSIATFVAGFVVLTHYADLLYELSLFRLTVRYKQSLLGWAWAVLQPLALMSVYTVIFTRVTKIATGGTPYPIFLLSALLPWTFFSSSVINAVCGMTAYSNLITKMYFPREIIPFSYLSAAFADFCIACVILAWLIVHYDVALSWNILYAFPVMLLLMAFAAAVALFFSAFQVRFRDIGLAMPVLLQVWMFTTPVVYSLQSVPARFRRLYLLDPVAGLIESFRSVVVYRTHPDFTVLTYSAVITLGCFVVGYVYFKAAEATMADIL
jgi:lipopolysaccharide transport system permease protein